MKPPARSFADLYRKISPELLQDPKFLALSQPNPCAGWLLIHLLVGPLTLRCPGIVPYGALGLAERLDWDDVETMRAALAELEAEGWAWTKGKLTFVPLALAMNRPDNVNQVIGWAHALAPLEISPVLIEMTTRIAAHLDTIGPEYGAAFRAALMERRRLGEESLKVSAEPSPPTLPSGVGGTQRAESSEQKAERRGGSSLASPHSNGNYPEHVASVVAAWKVAFRDGPGKGASPGEPKPWDLEAAEELVALHGVDLVVAVVSGAIRLPARNLYRKDKLTIAGVRDEWTALLQMHRKGEFR